MDELFLMYSCFHVLSAVTSLLMFLLFRFTALKEADAVDGAPKKGSSCLRLLVKLLFLALLIAVALYFYQVMLMKDGN